MNRKRSPFFYVGDKFKLVEQLIPLFPQGINTYYEPFLGGGTIAMNVQAKAHKLGDSQEQLIEMHRLFASFADPELLLLEIKNRLDVFGIKCSFYGAEITADLKREYPKTYFAVRNRDSFLELRREYNTSTDRDPLILYILIIFGFNRLLRFNKAGEFNVPVGNVDFNFRTASAIKDYVVWASESSVEFKVCDYRNLFPSKFGGEDFAYFDPPYLIADAEYNKSWSEDEDVKLYEFLDELTSRGLKWALSNSLFYRGRTNTVLENWSRKYNVHRVMASYLNYHDNLDKKSGEVLVTNYA
jgi:DNA adenine methylase